MSSSLTVIDFHGASLVAQQGATPADTLVAMKPVVEGMGLDWSAQFRRLKRNEVLAKGIAEMAIPSAGGLQTMMALPLSRLNFWLATIQPNMVPDPDTRAKVIRYQEECADVLFAHFFGQATGQPKIDLAAIEAVMDEAITKALDQRLPSMIEQRLSTDPRVAVGEFVSALRVLIENDVKPKGRRAFSVKVSYALRAWCATRGIVCRRDAWRGAWVFPVAEVKRWLEVEGKALIKAHAEALAGQTVIQFPKRAK